MIYLGIGYFLKNDFQTPKNNILERERNKNGDVEVLNECKKSIDVQILIAQIFFLEIKF